MIEFPNLAGVATADLVETIGTGKFSAAYINWSRTMHLLRQHAPGWLPEAVPAPDGYVLHQAPVGAYLLIRFRNGDTVTPSVPQAVMDARNAAIPIDKITARDITDTHRRGVCMAAAMLFGLAYELWAKMPLENGHSTPSEDDPKGMSETNVADWITYIKSASNSGELKKFLAEAVEAATEVNDTAAVAKFQAAAQEKVDAAKKKKAAETTEGAAA